MTGAIVIVLCFGFLSAIVLTQKHISRKLPAELDLQSVRDAMIEKHGWSEERAQVAQLEYVRFLILLQMRPGFMLVPWLDAQGRDDLDQFWHQHILDTAKYAADCKAVFGRMIHHNPHVARGSAEEQESIDRTRRLYARTFQTGQYGKKADSADFSGCSACGATMGDSGHHSSSSSDGHGHSGDSGGHSCGGHSCGGRGCGSSCGGGH